MESDWLLWIPPQVCVLGVGDGVMPLARDHGFTDLGDVPVSNQLAAA